MLLNHLYFKSLHPVIAPMSMLPLIPISSQSHRPLRHSTTSSREKNTSYFEKKYKIYRMKQSQPLNSHHSNPTSLPAIKNTKPPSSKTQYSKSKPSTLHSLPDCLLMIKQQKSEPPPRIKQLFNEFQQKHKNLQFIAELQLELREYNPIFKKLQQLVSCCLLRNSAIRSHQKGSYIYNKGDDSKQFYIILEGRVLLKSKKDFFRKICSLGETLCQEVVLHQQNNQKQYLNGKLEYAKTLSNVVLLEVSRFLYNRMEVQFNSRGQKHSMHTLKSILLINFLEKESIRKARFF